jgi:hypothetical protein
MLLAGPHPILIPIPYSPSSKKYVGAMCSIGWPNMDGLTTATWALVTATGLLAFGTFNLACYARTSARSYRAVERACVELSHTSELAFDPTRVSMQAHNAGRTPATVTEMFVEAVVGDLPAKP